MRFAVLALAAALAVPAVTSAAEAAPQQTVVLKSGEKIIGEVTKRTEKQIVVDSEVVGVVTLDAANVENVYAADGQVEPYVAIADPGLFGTGFLSGWERSFSAGVSGTSGTTDSTAINLQLDALTDNDSYRAVVGAWYFLNKNNGETSRNQTRVFGTYDKRIEDGPWFVFGRAQYDNDSIQLWENRLSGYAGPGYEFIRNDEYELLGRVGLGYTEEFGGTYPDGYDQSRFEALVGVDAKWQIDTNQRLTFSSYYFPSLENFAYGRTQTNLAYEADLNKRYGIGLRTGIEHRYDFRTPGEDEHNNWLYFMNVVMKL